MENKLIYLDNSATTELCPEARVAMLSAMEHYGNPSSLHSAGLEAHEIIEKARSQVALSLGVRSVQQGSIIFTSCGTEATNTAILGSIYSKDRRESDLIITTNSEHPSVANTVNLLEKQGFRVARIPTKGGVLDMDYLREVLREKPLLISIMMVNNETGALYDVKTAFSLAKASNPDVITHCDAVQGYLKCRFTPMSIGADFLTVSAHKIHGPKGIGALYISPEILKKRKLVPYLIGGGQEGGFRSGTENTVCIAGFGAAAEIGSVNLNSSLLRMEELRTYAAEQLSEIGVKLNIPAGTHAPHILSITVPGIRSETMLHHLSTNGICVSSGSACSSHSKKVSSTLLAFGLDEAAADSSVRISLCPENTPEDIDKLVSAVKYGMEKLVHKQ